MTKAESRIIPTTLVIIPNEKALALAEENQPSPIPGEGWRRVQSIFVVRGDRPAEWRHDLGPVANFKATQFRVPSYLEHTVAELQDIANTLRGDTDRPAEKILAEERAKSLETFEEKAQDHMNARGEVARNRSKFGPGYNKQRNR